MGILLWAGLEIDAFLYTDPIDTVWLLYSCCSLLLACLGFVSACYSPETKPHLQASVTWAGVRSIIFKES